MNILQLRVALISLIEHLDTVMKYENGLFAPDAEPAKYWTLPIVAQIMDELQKKGIYKSRVEKIRNTFRERMKQIEPADDLHRLMYRYSLLRLSYGETTATRPARPLPDGNFSGNDLERRLHTMQWHRRLSEFDTAYLKVFEASKNDLVSGLPSYPPEDFISELTDGYDGFYKVLPYI